MLCSFLPAGRKAAAKGTQPRKKRIERRNISLGAAPEVISQNRVYLGATAETAAIVTEVRVTAHSYTASEDGGVEINEQRYADTKTVYTVQNPDVTATDKKNVVTVEGATLISPDIG